MPELPEVEIIKRGLVKTIVGKRIVGIKVLREKSFKGNLKEVVGKAVKSVNRRAKLLIIELDDETFLVIHLKMTGQLIYKLKVKNEKLCRRKSRACSIETSAKTKIKNLKLAKLKNKKSPHDISELPSKYTRVIVEFGDSSKLFFNDLRVFGWMKVIAKSKRQKAKSFDEIIGEKFGPEVFSKNFTPKYLKEILENWGRPVKLLLMDQKKIAGIGNIYANEALFCAGIAPHHRGRDLLKDHPEKVKKLYECVKKVLEMGIKYGGSSASDDAFRDIKGERGKMQKHLMVYGKADEDCPNKCGRKIRKMKLGGRGTFFCPRCQS